LAALPLKIERWESAGTTAAAGKKEASRAGLVFIVIIASEAIPLSLLKVYR
jgi:hypothetical protein